MDFRFCPHCGKELPQMTIPAATAPSPPRPLEPSTYDQTAYWRVLHARVDEGGPPPEPSELVADLVRRAPVRVSSPQTSIVHMILDRSAAPAGGALLQGVLSEGRLGPAGSPERLETMGYVLVDGRVQQVDGVPVGRGYVALEYWGGARQHKRWHLTDPVALDSSRHGEPLFMDERCLAFGATWRDLDRFAEAMTSLIETFRESFDGRPIGNPLVVDVYWPTTSSTRA